MYQLSNKFKTCVPKTPMGECAEIAVNEVFLQGSSDAMLMAWNLMDSVNKSEDFCDPIFTIEGIQIPRLLFVDDILQMMRNITDLKLSLVGDETIERANRLGFKPSKCKLLYLNCESEPVELDGNILEVVEETEYLGTKVEDSGSRKKDMINRIKECKGVLNEIVEVLKLPGLSTIRLQYSEMLLGSCFKMKFKHGCEVWDLFNEGTRSLVNKLIPDIPSKGS
jgi:hypothetical protein